jgi:microsomal dipeptidase-like Zn-dependent dipeptidase
MRPFGQACPGIINNADPSHKNSIWHDDPPTRLDRRLNTFPSVTLFSQSDFTSLSKGNFKVIIAALNPIEKGFFKAKPDDRSDNLYNIVSGIGLRKINFIQENVDDFSELNCEYDFFRQLDNVPVNIYGEMNMYRLTSSWQDVKTNLEDQNKVISVIISIEGAYLFNNNNSLPPDLPTVLANVDKVKAWQHPPLYVTFCHHFYNHLAGHARSLPSFLKKRCSQEEGIDTGMEQSGKAVIRQLLSKTNGKRIYIDVKHMSRKTRMAYYDMLQNEFRGEDIPIIVSHGAVNGYPELNAAAASPEERNGLVNGRDINFYDDEIVRIARSKGIFGLQIDTRQVTNKWQKNKIKWFGLTKERKYNKWIALVWNQIRYVAELLERNGLPAWDTLCLGTDYDGNVTPIPGLWTSAHLNKLYKALIPLIEDYLIGKQSTYTANQILDKIFSGNTIEFLKKYYI